MNEAQTNTYRAHVLAAVRWLAAERVNPIKANRITIAVPWPIDFRDLDRALQWHRKSGTLVYVARTMPNGNVRKVWGWMPTKAKP